MNPHLIKINDDLFDIAARLKSVKSSYVVYYNTQLRRYEVYDDDKFAFIVPYDELDSRTIDYALKTSVQNADKLFAEVERHNDALAKNTIKSIVNETMNTIT